VYFQRDVANMLLAAYESKIQTLSLFGSGKEAASYHAGIRDTISTLALMFGLSPGSVLSAQSVPRLDDGDR